MSIAVSYEPIEMSRETYAGVVAAARREGAWPPPGLLYHATFEENGRLRTFEAWESVHDLQAFTVRLAALLAGAGVAPAAPTVSELIGVLDPAADPGRGSEHRR